jgi:AcrR family transcriptional regulator
MNRRAKLAAKAGSDSHPRREEILATAIRAFSAKGYSQVSLQEIAEEMGITKAAIYYYFKQKDEILGEALTRAGVALAESVREVAERDDLTPTEQVHEMLAAHIRNLLSHRALYSVYFSDISQVAPQLREELLKEERWYARAFAQVIEAGIESGEFRVVNPRPTTLALLGMCNSALRWFQPSHGLSGNELAEALAALAIRGIAAP